MVTLAQARMSAEKVMGCCFTKAGLGGCVWRVDLNFEAGRNRSEKVVVGRSKIYRLLQLPTVVGSLSLSAIGPRPELYKLLGDFGRLSWLLTYTEHPKRAGVSPCDLLQPRELLPCPFPLHFPGNGLRRCLTPRPLPVSASWTQGVSEGWLNCLQ